MSLNKEIKPNQTNKNLKASFIGETIPFSVILYFICSVAFSCIICSSSISNNTSFSV